MSQDKPSFHVGRLAGIGLVAALVACQPVKVGGTDGGGIDAADHADAGADIDAVILDAAPTDPCVGDVAFEDAPECYLAAICDMSVRCYGTYANIDDCMAAGSGLVDVEYLFRRLGDAIDAGSIAYDGTAAAACFAGIHAAECALLQEGDGPPNQACEHVFNGLVETGEVCYTSDDCADDGTCDRSGSCYLQCCSGLCQARAPLGFNCENASCVSGAHCVDTPGAGYLCQPGEAGSPCTGYWDCDDTFWCDLSESNPGVCVADFPAGSSCSDDAQCPLPQLCVGDDTAAGIGTCARADTLSASCDDECYGPYYCAAETDALGVCANLPGIGQSCAVSHRCAGQLRCDSSTSFCVARFPLHTSCNQTDECQDGLICTADLPGGAAPGQCENPSDDDTACNYDSQCQSNVCAGDPGLCEAYADCYQ